MGREPAMLRWSCKIVFFMVAGVVATVLAAWLALATSHLRPFTARALPWPPGTPADWPASQAWTVTASGAAVLRTWSNAADDVSPTPWPGPGGPRTTMARSSARTTHYASTLECGWPRLALGSTQWSLVSAGTRARVSAGKVSPWGAGWLVKWLRVPTGVLDERRLPVRPIWPGFAIDATVFAAVSGGLWHLPYSVRWAYRRRCGLCTRCAYPAGVSAVCTECGRRVRPWRGTARPAPPGSTAHLRRLARWCAAAVVVAIAAYSVNIWWSLYLKGPWGLYCAAWRGQLAAGRSRQPFESLGFEASATTGDFVLLFDWRSDLVGRQASVPVWLPIPVLAGIGLAAWWRVAVRRGLALHWPPTPEEPVSHVPP